jgi:gas vesicle protein
MILGILIGAVAGFVGGVLFGRRNTKKVELALAEANALLAKVKK